MNPHIDKQDLSRQKELKAKLLSVIAQHPRGLTKNEMLIKSGISQDLIDYSLRGILEEYYVHLEITDNQQVIYVFDVQNPKNKKLQNVLLLQKALQAIGRILIFTGAVLLAFSWVVIAIPIAFTILGLYLVAGFFHIFFNQGFSVGVREYMTYWLGRNDPKDKLSEEKAILSYITGNNYAITIAELMQIMDWSYTKAEQEAVWLLVNYGGEPTVEESGIIIYDFTHFKEDQDTGKQATNEYTIYQRNKTLDRLAYSKESIEYKQNKCVFIQAVGYPHLPDDEGLFDELLFGNSTFFGNIDGRNSHLENRSSKGRCEGILGKSCSIRNANCL
jgi:hypothetical protein